MVIELYYPRSSFLDVLSSWNSGEERKKGGRELLRQVRGSPSGIGVSYNLHDGLRI